MVAAAAAPDEPEPSPYSRYVDAGGIRTHLLDAGAGPALLLLHGGEYGAAAELTWEGCLPLLAERYRVLAVDLVGYGRSAKLRDFAGGQRRLMIRQVAALLAALEVEPVAVVGTSLSARMVLDTAARSAAAPGTPDRADPPWPLRAVVAAGIGLAPPDAAGRRVLEDFDGTLDGLRPSMAVLFHDPAWRDSEAYLRRRYAFTAIPGAWETAAAANLRSPVRAGGERRTHVQAPPRDYGGISVPVALIRGEHDRLVPDDTWRALAAQIPGARTTTIAGAGHYPQIERPAEFAAAVLEFLAEIAPVEVRR
ncbi:alpha/beta fold hydrolase [Pseudonocardia thermophila]|uniref:alpha/beta fold hydrolase n=1 Tax=Pseudonocardia thermophila TaxID=1848 RepID=UPI00248E90AF|nr:alpha/beta hydrolase [Pseudonocardia thermophila]